jgi:hypothetical protein
LYRVEKKTYFIVQGLGHTDSTSNEVRVEVLTLSEDNSGRGVSVTSQERKDVILRSKR